MQSKTYLVYQYTVFNNLYNKNFLSTRSKAFWKSIKAEKALSLLFILVFIIVYKEITWLRHDLSDLKPFCSSASICWDSGWRDKRLFMSELYSFAHAQSKLMPLKFKGLYLSMELAFGMGEMIALSHWPGMYPESNTTENNILKQYT